MDSDRALVDPGGALEELWGSSGSEGLTMEPWSGFGGVLRELLLRESPRSSEGALRCSGGALTEFWGNPEKGVLTSLGGLGES